MDNMDRTRTRNGRLKTMRCSTSTCSLAAEHQPRVAQPRGFLDGHSGAVLIPDWEAAKVIKYSLHYLLSTALSTGQPSLQNTPARHNTHADTPFRH